MRNVVLLALFILIVQSSMSQSLLWEVTGKKLDKPSYLYGTIHIQDERVFGFDTIVLEKFEACDAYAMEILMDELDKETIEKSMLMADGKTLQDILSDEDYKELDAYFKEKLGQSVFLYQKMKPFFISSQIMQADMNQDMPDPLDLHFLKKARKEGKLAFGVEEFEDQIGAIDQISLEDQAKMLMESIRDTSKESEQFDELLETYLAGDIQKMPELSADTSMPEKFNEAFLITRNVTMAKNAIKLMKEQPTFIAVGAAHLGGPEGVIELIRKKGYEVKPIKFEFEKSTND